MCVYDMFHNFIEHLAVYCGFMVLDIQQNLITLFADSCFLCHNSVCVLPYCYPTDISTPLTAAILLMILCPYCSYT